MFEGREREKKEPRECLRECEGAGGQERRSGRQTAGNTGLKILPRLLEIDAGLDNFINIRNVWSVFINAVRFLSN